jgi:hypothetical protein
MKQVTIDQMPGHFEKGRWIIDYGKTLTIIGDEIKEKWFVFDPDNGNQLFDTEKEALEAYLKVIDAFRDEACDGWSDEVEDVVWGKVCQTTELREIPPPWNADPDDWEGEAFADAFAIEHRT